MLTYLKAWQNEDSVLDAGIGEVEIVERATNLIFGKKGSALSRSATRLLL